ncbi:PREDICTED: serine protease gd-like [Vollenhovia emeryi]|uniref:serine protease gd-like n=1 Tax=Vollenhovia emeryi TaxID=411798 RepID=UPI0005F4737B|nr:PREDICTED: serine protease gd-like [Vollenhovia emeryi]XP_011859651.1 PREDICTED: serine protease gd-like [Vollenhovia emeryi]XP_011859652.1 PREDICTED: serine protease gd-like [Vollenhovia emeryi]XP_011859653.1 PREDICTED: serine protease gd-like [Vollenhovia emeryi]XP_011859654.1 PREDICTED: serine protease gd-like [Vollenhovia emeryi]XP_011859655.1 PREDICTED: serine protease gd-like [Vollenhovia emeryi]XP_011859656.1 PREDICTED: serine protease gd-like [Vollenhovia emeryi]XP_011859657.1 PRE
MAHKIFLTFALLPHLLCTMVHGTTSCLEYFTYEIDPKTYKIFGRIEIFSPPGNDEIHLKIALKTTANSLRRLFRLELARSIRESVQAIEQDKPLLYHVYFPSDVTFPMLSTIWFNNQQYCVEKSGGNIIADIELGHIVYPPNKVPLSQNFQPWHRNSSNYRIIYPTYHSNIECGVTSYYTDNTNRLIPNGETSSPGQWPWIVAVYHIRNQMYKTVYEFRCGGSILTNKHILTAGRCVMYNSNRTIPAKVLEVIVGHIDLSKIRRDGIANPEVAGYVIHPDFVYKDNSASFDVAVLTLKKPIEFNPLIKPICLWYGSNVLDDIVQETGYVVGWGEDMSGRRNVREQRIVKVKIVSQETCLRRNKAYLGITSERTFCAGGLEVGPCNGDKGSGIVLYNNITGRYHLRGLLASTLRPTDNSSLCDDRAFTVYVDITKYVPWIHQQISTYR